MSRTFLISDLHLGHQNILSFRQGNGNPLRGFSSIDQMHQVIVDRWNRQVSAKDKVYVLGDVAFRPSHLRYVEALNGDKVLIKGNHDTLKPSLYLQYFRDIRAYWVLDKILLAHIPIHPDSLSRWRGQIHGHTHANDVHDSRYYNVSVEAVDYTPVDFEEIREYYVANGNRLT